jgi:hypothetical protein
VGRLRTWARRLLGRSAPPGEPPAEPPDEEPAFVGRRPRPPQGSGSVALEPPDEPDDVDARGREAPE